MELRRHEELLIKLTGAVTEVDYEDGHNRSFCFSSLKDLCATKLVSDYLLLSKYCDHLPRTLKHFLMSKAIADGRHVSLLLLLKYWPDEIFSLQLPSALKTWRLFYMSKNSEVFKSLLVQLFNCTWLVVQNFIDIIKLNSECQMRCIDLSEIPTMDASVKRICSFICYKDQTASFSKEPCIMYKSNLKKSGDIGRKTDIVAKRKQCKYIVKVNCTLNSKQTLQLLCSAIEAGRAGASNINLVVTGLRISEDTRFSQVIYLLNLVNPQDLELFCTDFYYYSVTEFEQLIAALKKFHNLKALDLSYTGLDCHRHAILFVSLSKLIQEFVHLNRLDLSNCRISGGLNIVLGKLYCTENDCDEKVKELKPKKQKTSCCINNSCFASFGKLTYLSLAGCRLLVNDISYLKDSPHAKTLNNLNLSDNHLELSSLIQLLVATSENLRILEVENCHLDVNQIDPLFTTLSSMKKLKFLNIAGLNMHPEHLLSKAPDISQMSDLQCFRFSYFNDHATEHLIAKKGFMNKFKNTLEKLWNNSSRSLKIMCR